jgi:Ca-activated chloride channel homolog
VTLLSAWALAGLLLAVPLILAHLRRRRLPVKEVDSLLPWRELAGAAVPARRRLGAPVLPLLLALQLAAVAVLVLGLARPVGGAPRPRASEVFVIDDSIWMQVQDGNSSRLQAAAAAVAARVRGLPGDTQVSIVLAASSPRILYRGAAAGATATLASLAASDGPANLAAALRLAVGLGSRRGERILLARAPEDAQPSVSGAGAALSQMVIGTPSADQGLTGADARCGLPGADPCEAFARVQNAGAAPTEDIVTALLRGAVAARTTVAVPAHGGAAVAFHVPAGARLELELAGGDALAADDRAFVAVPGLLARTVTLVGRPAEARVLAAALASLPGVRLRLRTPSDYRSGEARECDLLVLDGWLPAGALPAAPALVLVDPPRLAGGQVRGRMQDTAVSGSEPSSPLLSGVQTLSLAIDAGAGARLRLPDWMRAALWSPEGPLLAAGQDGGRRVALLSFDPSQSNLPELEAFPQLVANIVSYTQEWAPAQALAGEPVLYDTPPGATSMSVTTADGATARLAASAGVHALTLATPGFATIAAGGPWGRRTLTVAVDVQLPAPTSEAAVPLVLPAEEPGPVRRWWPWLIAAALALVLAELLYVTRSLRAREALG